MKSANSFSDTVQVQGAIKIEVFDAKTGKFLYCATDKPNLVCINTRLALTNLLDQSGGNLDYERIWSIYVGDDNTPPTTVDTALIGANQFGKVVVQPVTIIGLPTSGIIEVEMTLAAGDHNNQYLRECGLYTQGSAAGATVPPNVNAHMLARQIHGEVYKTAGITVKYNWRYRIVA